jgi:hypothetical protein
VGSAFVSEAGLDPGLGQLLRYLAFLLLAIAAPGAGLQWWWLRTVVPALVVPVGLAFCAAAYAAGLALGQPWLFLLGIGIASAGVLRRQKLPNRGPALPWPSLAWFGVAIIVFLALTQYPANRALANGQVALDPLVTADTVFHVGLTHELTLDYRPQTPGLSGVPLAYHLGADLVRAAALRHFGIAPLASLSHYEVTVGALALGLGLASLASAMGLPRFAVAAAPWTLLLTDFSFVLGASPRAHWWADLLRGNALLSLAYSNPVVPALILTCGSLVALSVAAGEKRFGAVSVGLASAVPFFKVFLGAQLAGALLVALILGWRNRASRLWLVGSITGIMLGTVFVVGQDAGSVAATFAPFDLPATTLRQLGWPDRTGTSLAAFGAVWLLLSLGLRVLGVVPALKTLLCGPPVAIVVAALALSGWAVGMLVRVAATTLLPGEPAINDAAFFAEQGGVFLWLFTLPPLAATLGSRGSVRSLAWVVVAALTLPSTIQFVVKKRQEPSDPLPAPMVRAVEAVSLASRPGEVVLTRPGERYPSAISLLGGRRVVLERFTPYLTQFARSDQLATRHALVYRFFRTHDRDEARAIAGAFGARYVCLFGDDRLRFDTHGFLTPIFEETGASAYAIIGDPGSRP